MQEAPRAVLLLNVPLAKHSYQLQLMECFVRINER